MTIALIESPPQRDLGELAEIINTEHREMWIHLGKLYSHAIRCGEALLEARSRFEDAQRWAKWCRENIDLQPHQASRYMRVAECKDLIPPEAWQPYKDRGGSTREVTFNRLYRYTRGLPVAENGGGKDPITKEQRQEIRRLRKEGLPYQRIADAVGFSLTAVYYVCNPQKEKEKRDRMLARDREFTAAKKALDEKKKRQERDRAARAAGGDIELTYATIRTALSHAERARDTAAGHEVRQAMADAATHLGKAEDSLARAFRSAEMLA